MINKIYKTIHNKYSNLFRFVFFLRYLIIIFFISSIIFLIIPHFFDYKKRELAIKNYLFQNYNLVLEDYKNINYSIFPIPKLKIQSAIMSIEKNTVDLEVKELNIFPKILNIYNFDNFRASKIVLVENKIELGNNNIRFFLNYILKLKNKLILKNLNLKIKNNNKTLINFKEIEFSNFGYNKNFISGKVFDKKFKIDFSESKQNIVFELLKTGLKLNFNFDRTTDNSISGSARIKLLNSNLKFKFKYDENTLNIYESFFRNKNLSFSGESTIKNNPFFSFNSIIKINDIERDFLQSINIERIFNFKNILKKINTKKELYFNSKKISNNLIENFYIKIDLAYGKLNFSKKTSLQESFSLCDGDINLLDEYPILNFDCTFTSKNLKKLTKKFSVKYKKNEEVFELKVKGKMNIFNNKINFASVKVGNDYTASKEDLKYFKKLFENILFDKNFINIFNVKKIGEFIQEII